MTDRPKLSHLRKAAALICLLIIALAWVMVLRADDGLVQRPLQRDNVPMHYLGPTEPGGQVPGVIIAHGFSGSKQLMQGYAYLLAQAGYGTLSFDFPGHAANPRPFASDGEGLQAALEASYAELLAQPEIDSERIALIGHSMGSGAVMTAAIENPDRYVATIAISPTDAEVTAVTPPNLFLMAGQLEAPFVENAEDLLVRAGGANVNFAAGQARSFQLIPAVEHISILFSPIAHEAALNWLNQSFDWPAQTDFVDTRLGWYLLQLLAWLVLATAVTPIIRAPKIEKETIRRPPWHWLGLLLAPLLATAVLFALNLFFPVSETGGVLIAGAMGIWFLVAGLVWLGLGLRPLPPTVKSGLWGLLIFAYLWLAFGLMAQVVWLPWLLIPARWGRWLLLALALLPLTLAAGWAFQGTSTRRRIGWWLLQSVVLSAGLVTAVFLVPGLFFLVLILPLLPLVIGLMMIVGGAVDEPWAYGLGNALFFAWLLMALFPIVG